MIILRFLHSLHRQHGFDCNHYNSRDPLQCQYQLLHHITHKYFPAERKFTCKLTCKHA